MLNNDRISRIEKIEAELKQLKDEVLADIEVRQKGSIQYYHSGVFFPKAGDFGFNTNGTQIAYVSDQDIPQFRTRKAFNEWVFALRILMKLRAQPGVVPTVFGTPQWTVGYATTEEVGPHLSDKGKFFGGAWNTEEDVAKAIKEVGADRIVRALKILAWIE